MQTQQEPSRRKARKGKITLFSGQDSGFALFCDSVPITIFMNPEPKPKRGRPKKQPWRPISPAAMNANYIQRLLVKHGESFVRGALQALREDEGCPFHERLLAADVAHAPLEALLSAYQPPLLSLRVLRMGSGGKAKRVDIAITWSEEEGRPQKMRFRLNLDEDGRMKVLERTQLMDV